MELFLRIFAIGILMAAVLLAAFTYLAAKAENRWPTWKSTAAKTDFRKLFFPEWIHIARFGLSALFAGAAAAGLIGVPTIAGATLGLIAWIFVARLENSVSLTEN